MFFSVFDEFFKGIKLFLVELVLVEAHVVGKKNIFCDFCSYFVQISIIEDPVFREHLSVRGVSRFYFSCLLIKRN